MPKEPLIIAIIVLAVLTALFLSPLIPPLAGLGGMGVGMVRSALNHKSDSWIAGLVLGGFFAFIGTAGVVGILLN